MELISVIVPVYKVEQYLDKCIESITGQTYSNLEIILVDDGSPDNCPKMCDAWAKKDSRIRVIHKENGGLSSARNAGIDIAKGAYLSFVDSDDFLDLDYIEYLYKLVKSDDAEISMCKHRIVSQSGSIIERGRSGYVAFDTYECLEDFLYFGDVDTSAWGKLYKSELFESVRYPEGKIFEDLATTYKLILLSKKIMCGFESKYNYLVRDNSISTSSFSEKMLTYSDVTDEMAQEVVRCFPELDRAAMARKVRSRFSVINLMINSEERGYQREKKACRDYILKNARSVLSDKNVKKNEKVAIHLIRINMRLYEFSWRKIRGRVL